MNVEERINRLERAVVQLAHIRGNYGFDSTPLGQILSEQREEHDESKDPNQTAEDDSR